MSFATECAENMETLYGNMFGNMFYPELFNEQRIDVLNPLP